MKKRSYHPGGGSLAGVLGQCIALTHLDLCGKDIERDGAGSLAEVLGQSTAMTHLDLSHNVIDETGSESLSEEWWSSAHRWLTSISTTITSDQTGQRV
jgi:hypothetical protein